MTLPLTESLQQAVAHHQAGRLAEAERLYRDILGADPRQPDACHNLGVIAMQVGQPSAGLPLVRQAVEIAPEQALYWLTLIDCALQAGWPALARDAFAAARGSGVPEDALARFARQLAAPEGAEISALLALLANGPHAEAEAAAGDMTRRFPAFPWGWKALGLALQVQGRALPAIAALRRAAALEPADMEIYSNLGDALRRAGNAPATLANHRRALRLDPGSAGAHDNLGIVHQEMRAFAAAAASFRRALALAPALAQAHDNLGSTLRQDKRPDAALAHHRRALALTPSSPDFLNNHGAALKEAGDFAAAAPLYHRTLALIPEHAGAWHNLAGLRGTWSPRRPPRGAPWR